MDSFKTSVISDSSPMHKCAALRNSFATSRDEEIVRIKLQEYTESNPQQKYEFQPNPPGREFQKQEYELGLYEWVHHINFFGKAVFSKSATPPAVSLVVIMAEAKKEHAEFRTSPRMSAILSNAFKFVDPVRYQGTPSILHEWRGSKLQAAVTGACDKFYSEHGQWADDYYSLDEDFPTFDHQQTEYYMGDTILNGWHENHGLPTRESHLLDAHRKARHYLAWTRQRRGEVNGTRGEAKQPGVRVSNLGKSPLCQIVDRSEVEDIRHETKPSSSHQSNEETPTATSHPTPAVADDKAALQDLGCAPIYLDESVGEKNEPPSRILHFSSLEDLFAEGESWADEVGEPPSRMLHFSSLEDMFAEGESWADEVGEEETVVSALPDSEVYLSASASSMPDPSNSIQLNSSTIEKVNLELVPIDLAVESPTIEITAESPNPRLFLVELSLPIRSRGFPPRSTGSFLKSSDLEEEGTELFHETSPLSSDWPSKSPCVATNKTTVELEKGAQPVSSSESGFKIEGHHSTSTTTRQLSHDNEYSVQLEPRTALPQFRRTRPSPRELLWGKVRDTLSKKQLFSKKLVSIEKESTLKRGLKAITGIFKKEINVLR